MDSGQYRYGLFVVADGLPIGNHGTMYRRTATTGGSVVVYLDGGRSSVLSPFGSQTGRTFGKLKICVQFGGLALDLDARHGNHSVPD